MLLWNSFPVQTQQNRTMVLHTMFGVSMSMTCNWSRPGWTSLEDTGSRGLRAVPFPSALMKRQLVPYPPQENSSTNMVLLLDPFLALGVICCRDTQSMEYPSCTCGAAIQRKDVGRFAFIPPISTCSPQTGCIPLTFCLWLEVQCQAP